MKSASEMNTAAEPLRIYCDLDLDPALEMELRESVAPYILILPERSAASVLDAPPPDPALRGAEIALGQPDPQAALSSPTLQWIHLSTAGYTRYDNAHFRAAADARGLLVTNSSSVYAEACAEHALGFLLAQARRLPRSVTNARRARGCGVEILRNASRCLAGKRS